MEKKRYYLAHSSHDESIAFIKKWIKKKEAEPFPVSFINPFYDVGEEAILRKKMDDGLITKERYRELLIPSKIVRQDLEAIDGADGVLAWIGEFPTYGTVMEIMYAWEHTHHPVWLIVTNNYSYNPWLKYHCNCMFASFADFEAFIRAGGGGE